jgi:hypothetical protein
MRELFDVHLQLSYVEAQLGVTPTKPSWLRAPSTPSDNWRTRRPYAPHSVGWVWVYPSSGVLTSIADDCRMDDVLLYNRVAQQGDVFGSGDGATVSCVDAVATFLIRGPDDDKEGSTAPLPSASSPPSASAASSTTSTISVDHEFLFETGAVASVNRVFEWYRNNTVWSPLGHVAGIPATV